MNGDDGGEIRRLTEELTRIAHAMTASMVNQQATGGPQPDTGQSNAGYQEPSTPNDDDVVDAEFQEVA
ncbi:MAG: molecular chaperone DnaK, partial [Thermodesulfobacteriota bacterium]|nr:molecular chaperone DnaK [Thermodesulfobacteriota bacterium]